MNKHLAKMAWLAAATLGQVNALAEDTDLFVGIAPADNGLSNVLLVMDNAGSFSANESGGQSTCTIDGATNTLSGKVAGIEQCALYSVISALPTTNGASVNLGVMVYNDSGVVDYAGNTCYKSGGSANGGCLVYPISPMTADNKKALLGYIKSWNFSGSGAGSIKGNSAATGAVMQEAWAYYAGKTGLSGRVYDKNIAAGCQHNYVVFVGNSYASSGTPGDSTGTKGPKDALEGNNPVSGMNASPAATSTQKLIIQKTIDTTCKAGPYTLPAANKHENGGFYADEWARYMFSQNIITYSIGVLGSACQSEYAALLSSMGDVNVAGGKYFPTNNFAELSFAFSQVFSEVQAVNSAFSSVSLPVSVNTQGTYLNQVFVGMFRPDKDALPRWRGNLKQYKLGFDSSNTLQLMDANSVPAVQTGSGFITPCARSNWTPTVVDTYWSFDKQSDCLAPAGATDPDMYKKSNTPDGNIVEKGGHAYKLRNIGTSRLVKTCVACSAQAAIGSTPTSLEDFATGNSAITDVMLGLSSGDTTGRTAIINWARGIDLKDENGNSVTNEIRPSIHGDIVHSRPVAVNFGSDASPKVVVFYGGNDGVFRAINGNRETLGLSIGTSKVAQPGEELWSFIAPESFGILKRLYDNSQQIQYPGSSTGAPKPYGMDGPIVAYQNGTNDVLIFASMRRGGRMLYAFKVSYTDPSVISFLWKRGCPNQDNDSGCTDNMSQIGQTWSLPNVIRAKYTTDPLLMVGGGYAKCDDTATRTCSSSNVKGNQIFVLNAKTGELLSGSNLKTDGSLVGDVKVVPDADGNIAYAYAADTWGNVWRVSGLTANAQIGNTAPDKWTITKIASLGCDTTSSCSTSRKFLFGPDVVYDNGVYNLLLGSGDREKPLLYTTASGNVTNKVKNYFFLIKDNPGNSTWLSSENGTCTQDVICLGSLLVVARDTTPSATALDGKKGWAMAMEDTEQVVSSSVTLYGVSTFNTHKPYTPVTGVCKAELGTARAYSVAYATVTPPSGSTSLYTTLPPDIGLAPPPIVTTVTLDNGQKVVVNFGAKGPLSPTIPTRGPSTVTSPKVRSYWYIKK